jgi:hypothetical protein
MKLIISKIYFKNKFAGRLLCEIDEKVGRRGLKPIIIVPMLKNFSDFCDVRSIATQKIFSKCPIKTQTLHS